MDRVVDQNLFHFVRHSLPGHSPLDPAVFHLDSALSIGHRLTLHPVVVHHLFGVVPEHRHIHDIVDCAPLSLQIDPSLLRQRCSEWKSSKCSESKWSESGRFEVSQIRGHRTASDAISVATHSTQFVGGHFVQRLVDCALYIDSPLYIRCIFGALSISTAVSRNRPSH